MVLKTQNPKPRVTAASRIGSSHFLLEPGAPASPLCNQDLRHRYNENQHRIPILGTTIMPRGKIAGGKLAKMLSSVRGYQREGSSGSCVSSHHEARFDYPRGRCTGCADYSRSHGGENVQSPWMLAHEGLVALDSGCGAGYMYLGLGPSPSGSSPKRVLIR